MTRRVVMALLLGVAALVTSSFAVIPAAYAQEDGSPAPAPTAAPQGLTETDYFKTIKVVQKKPVTKARRFEIAPFFAYQPNDDFVRGYVPGAHIGFHFNEGVSLEGTFGYGVHSDKQLLKQVRKSGVQPAVLDRMELLASAGFNWAPIYGKLSYLERSILTYDLFLTTGYGVTNTDLEITTSTGGGGAGAVVTEHRKESFQGYYIGIGQRYYLRNWGAIRVELRNYSYTQRVDSSYNNRNNLLLVGGFSFLL